MRDWAENGDAKSRHPLAVIVMDLICNTPFYDRHLIECLARHDVRLRLAIPTFDREPDYFRGHGLQAGRGLLDVVGKLGWPNSRKRRLLKGLEWAINQAIVMLWVAWWKPDILHVQWLTFPTTYPFERWFLRWVRRRGVPIVYTVHDLLPHERKPGDVEAYGEVYRLADALICHTYESRSRLVELFDVDPARVAVIPQGPAFHDRVSISREQARATLGYSPRQIVVLAPGMIRPYKGTEFLLEAWQLASRMNRDLVLAIVGRAKDSAYLDQVKEEITRHGIEGSVRTHFEYQPEERLIAHHAAADILVYPYKEVTQSAALLTGMTFEKPIVATRVGGLGETLRDGETAVLVDYGDGPELAHCLVHLAEQPSVRRRLGEAAAADVAARFAWPDIAAQTLQLYRDVSERTYGPADGRVPLPAHQPGSIRWKQ
jgi:glycosyltransferase involved in cell wall biosynthesis